RLASIGTEMLICVIGRGAMNLITRNFRFVTVLAITGLLAGCAFGTRQPTLIYPPAPESGIAPVASAAPVLAPRKLPVTLVSFVDQRSDKKVVGTVRNGLACARPTLYRLTALL